MNIENSDFEKALPKEKKCLINYFKKFDKTRWMFFIAMWFFIICFCFIIKDFVAALQANTKTNNGWTSVDRFTYQSNILLLIYSVFIVFWPNHQFLRADKFLISNMVYIFFTFVGYNLILAPLGSGYKYTGNSYDISYGIGSSVWEHVICPVLFIIIGFIKMVWNPNAKLKSYWSTMLTGMIYPTVYVIYIASIPFVLNTDGVFNPDGQKVTYSVYGSATDTLNNPTFAWPIIVCMYLIFFPGSYAIFYYSYWGIQKHLGFKNKNKISK